MHSTNYTNTFITVADDCKTDRATVPPEKQEKSIARLQYAFIHNHPYYYTSDEVLFTIHALRKQVPPDMYEVERAALFSKGQPCLRASPLGKTYGWGIHYDQESKIALYPRESEAYQRLQANPALTHLKAMRSSKQR
jgi:hypothetical protein